jgi:D-arginine dehydrogenase
MSRFDIAIIGAGMAGASLAAALADKKSVLLLEAEEYPGYHSTGRSAAFWTETYGGPAVQPLTTASGPFLAKPPPELSDRSFLIDRSALHIGTAADLAAANAMLRDFASSGVQLESLSTAQLATKLSGLHRPWDVALWEPTCADIDVGALHNAYLRYARKSAVKIVAPARVTSMRYRQSGWQLETSAGSFAADHVVNAAGAWADSVAVLAGLKPIGIQPFRRTMVQLQTDPPAPAKLPLVVGLDGSFYFKPEPGGRIWLSPHDETPSAACDAAPEDIDVAKALARFEEVVDWRITKLERKWAGLRSFASDRLPVIGPSPDNPAFVWLAGQGGFGIQTAPAIAKLVTSLLTDVPHGMDGVNPELYSPARFH